MYSSTIIINITYAYHIKLLFLFFFFFQAEDGIRDYKVTGVQTCALPILTEHQRATACGPCTEAGPSGCQRPATFLSKVLTAASRRLRTSIRLRRADSTVV